MYSGTGDYIRNREKSSENGTFGCVGNTIRMRSGIYFDFANPNISQIDILDIAGGLAKECRFQNQVDPQFETDWPFYSVAEHSVAAAKLAKADGHDSEVVFACLMHDAAEAYTRDIAKPYKIMLPDYQRVYKKVEAIVGLAFGIDFEKWHDVIKLYDEPLMIAERNALFSPDNVEWHGESTARIIDYKPRCLNPIRAELEFLRAYIQFRWETSNNSD